MSKHINLDFGNSYLSDVEVDKRTTVNTLITKWESTNYVGFNFYTLEGVEIKDASKYFVITMEIPHYFLEEGHGFNGLFLFEVKENPKLINYRNVMMGVGKHGCAKILNWGGYSTFKFNHNYFLPFVLNDFTVAYYVCEERFYKEWVDNAEQGFTQVSIDQPITYDPLLGLYSTRSAELISDKIADAYSYAISH